VGRLWLSALWVGLPPLPLVQGSAVVLHHLARLMAVLPAVAGPAVAGPAVVHPAVAHPPALAVLLPRHRAWPDGL
jgi:hypothetical protein